MRRIESEELLDHDVAPEEMARSLRDLRMFNRVFGGIRAYRMLVRRLRGDREHFSILDLGTGSSDLLEAFPRAFRVGLDLKMEHLRFGQALNGGVKRLNADTLRLPFRDASVDIVGSSHFFHHFTPDQNVEILRESLRVARVGVFVTDTLRSRIPLVTVQFLGALRLLGRVTRFDAPASVRQGYTRSEVRDI